MQLPNFAAAPETLRFDDDLFEEHLDEAAFFYGQRAQMLADPEFAWTEVDGTERRLDAHLDALVVGRRPAQEKCLQRAKSGDPNDLFVAVCLLCRHRDTVALSRLISGNLHASAQALTAVRDALRLELPVEWEGFMAQGLATEHAPWVAVFADVCGYRRLDLTSALLASLRRGLSPIPVIRALGQLRSTAALPGLRPYINDRDPAVRAAAFMALARIGEWAPVIDCTDIARQESWPRLVLGLCGSKLAADTLMAVAASDAVDADAIEALGLLGDPKSVPILQALLQTGRHAETVARALLAMTGGRLFDEQFVADEVDEASLSEAELTAWRSNGDAPMRSDGQPFGRTVRHLSVDATAWATWLAPQRVNWSDGLRHRLGMPCTPGVCVSLLSDPQSDRRLRQLVAIELGVRYGCDIPFEPDMPVARQRRALAQMQAWAAVADAEVSPGAWTFHRRRL